MTDTQIPPEQAKVEPSPVDDDTTRAFIDGWNARNDHTDFDMALHHWMLSSVTHVAAPSSLPAVEGEADTAMRPDETAIEYARRISEVPTPVNRDDAEVRALIAELQPLVDKAASPNGWDWMFPLRVNPVDGKPTIVSHKGGNLFRGYIGTWQEADLLVALANAAPRILAALSASPSQPVDRANDEQRVSLGAYVGVTSAANRKYPDAAEIAGEAFTFLPINQRIDFDKVASPVAGGEVEGRFALEWIGAPRPPVHPNPMTGRQSFGSFDGAIAFMRKQPPDATFVSLREDITQRVDRTEDARAALASPGDRT